MSCDNNLRDLPPEETQVVTAPMGGRITISEILLVDPDGAPYSGLAGACAPSGSPSSSPSLTNRTVHDVVFSAWDLDMSSPHIHRKPGTLDDCNTGACSVTLPPSCLQCPGIFEAELAARNRAGEILHVTPLYLNVPPSLSVATPSRTLTTRRLRTATRDICARNNFLLDAVEFSDSEVCYAIIAAVREFNDTPPPLPRTYGTRNFQWERAWLTGAIGYLLNVSVHSYVRNFAKYQGDMGAIDDKDKWREYTAVGESYMKQWQELLIRIKHQENMRTFAGSVGRSEYFHLGTGW